MLGFSATFSRFPAPWKGFGQAIADAEGRLDKVGKPLRFIENW
jgi:hypothetical protein